MKYMISLVVAFTIGVSGCAHSPTDKGIDDKASLKQTIRSFHRDMRWRRWESAAMLVHPDRRQEFLGRYDELGDDFHIANLDLKSLARQKDRAILDIEQESYSEPAMIVKKKRFIEIWDSQTGDWLLADRMPKDEYKKRKRAARSPAEGTSAVSPGADADSADTGSASASPTTRSPEPSRR